MALESGLVSVKDFVDEYKNDYADSPGKFAAKIDAAANARR